MKIKMKPVALGMLVLIIATLLTACDNTVMFMGSSYSTPHKIGASYKSFTGTKEKKVHLKEGETLAVDYGSEVKKGELTIKLYDPDNELLQDLSTGESGNEKIEVSKDGTYRFEITGNKTKGSYKLSYKVE